MSQTDSHHAHDGDGHSHHEWRESQPPLGPASLLDIGGDVGAVSVRLDGDTPSGELMACPSGQPEAHFHTGVHLREIGVDTAWAAVFPEVVAETTHCSPTARSTRPSQSSAGRSPRSACRTPADSPPTRDHCLTVDGSAATTTGLVDIAG